MICWTLLESNKISLMEELFENVFGEGFVPVFETGVYRLTLMVNNVNRALTIDPVEFSPGKNKVIAMAERNDDVNQLWLYNSRTKVFISFSSPKRALFVEQLESAGSPIYCQDLMQLRGFQFYESNKLIMAYPNGFYVSFNPQDSDFVVRTSNDLPTDYIISLVSVDISAFEIDFPPPYLPFSMTFFYGAQETALTAGSKNQSDNSTIELRAADYEYGMNENQLFIYSPAHNDAVISLTNQEYVLDATQNGEEFNVNLKTHNNQQWSFSHGCILDTKTNKVLSYIQEKSSKAKFFLSERSSNCINNFTLNLHLGEIKAPAIYPDTLISQPPPPPRPEPAVEPVHEVSDDDYMGFDLFG